MTVPAHIDDLTPAVDLILQPLVLEALVAVDEGKALEDALPADTDAEMLAAAVRRLATIGAVHPCPDSPFGHHQLTARGRQLLQLLESLDALTASSQPVGRD